MKKENLPLLIGLLIPVLMIVFVMVSIYLPTLLTQPKCNFVYESGGDYYAIASYAVEGVKLVKKEITYPHNFNNNRPYNEPKLYVYNVINNISTQISFEEAQQLNLNSGPASPDGFEISSGTDEYSIFSLFFSRGGLYGDKYIRGHGIAKRLNLRKHDPYWSSNFHFIGWIL